eukprot:8640_1
MAVLTNIWILSLFLFVSYMDARFIYESDSESITKSIDNTGIEFDLTENQNIVEIPASIQTQKRYFKTQQYHRGLPIYGATLVIEQNELQNKKPIFGNWFNPQNILQCVPTINATITIFQALQIIFNTLNITSNDIYRNISTDLQIYFTDHSDTECFLTYIIKFIYKDITRPNDIFQPLIIFEALNHHKILKLHNQPQNLLACGEGGNAKMGQHEYCVNKPGVTINSATNPVLRNADIEIYDNENNAWNNQVSVPIITCSKTSSTKCTVNEGTVNGAYGVAMDVYAYAVNTWTMFNQWMDEAPILYPKPFPIYVHVGTNWGNANYAGIEINFGDGGTSWHPLGTITIAAHEIAHGYTDRSSGLVYYEESGGMNEAYSDIVGQCAEWYLLGFTQWKNGHNMVKSNAGYDALRWLYNPPLDGDSIDNYCNMYPILNVHYSSGLYNKAAYLLSASNTYAWSMEQIFKVFSTANKYYWTSTSTFNQGVCGLISALNLLYGSNTALYNTMEGVLINSFEAVGLRCNGQTFNCGAWGYRCGTNPYRYCYYENVPVSSTQAITHTRTIKGYADEATTWFYIYFTIKNFNCINPRITLQVENIDYDSYSTSTAEMLEIYDHNNALIKRHTANDVICGSYEKTLNYHSINNGQTITKNTQYIIKIKDGDAVHDLCENHLTVNAILQFHCDKAPTPSPTPSPTPAPTKNPTPSPTHNPTPSPTPAPTKNPTPSPTHNP